MEFFWYISLAFYDSFLCFLHDFAQSKQDYILITAETDFFLNCLNRIFVITKKETTINCMRTFWLRIDWTKKVIKLYEGGLDIDKRALFKLHSRWWDDQFVQSLCSAWSSTILSLNELHKKEDIKLMRNLIC